MNLYDDFYLVNQFQGVHLINMRYLKVIDHILIDLI